MSIVFHFKPDIFPFLEIIFLKSFWLKPKIWNHSNTICLSFLKFSYYIMMLHYIISKKINIKDDIWYESSFNSDDFNLMLGRIVFNIVKTIRLQFRDRTQIFFKLISYLMFLLLMQLQLLYYFTSYHTT